MDIFIRNKAYPGPVRAVVLDWAGTTVDYGSIGPVAVFMEVFKSRGVDVSPSEARGPMGMMKRDHIRAMCATESIAERWQEVHGRLPDEEDVESMYQETEPLILYCIAKYSDPIPGVLESVDALRERGIKIGSSTGYTGPIMDTLVPEARKKGYEPDCILCSTDVPRGRPYPFMCYKNAINLQVYPMEAMVKIGDTLTDIHEGLNAGMWTVGLTKTGNELGLSEEEVSRMDPEELSRRLVAIEERFRKAGAHYTAESLEDCVGVIERIEARLAAGERP